jgi:anti-sigma-K factor RskA
MSRKELEDIIKSGVLESYVLGSVTPEESAEVERLKVEHPEISEEITKIEIGLEQMIQAQSVVVPLHVEQAILDATVGGNTSIPENTAENTIISKSIMHSMSPMFLVLAILGTLAAIYFYQSGTQKDRENELLKTEIFALEENCDNIARSFEFLLLPDTRKIVLAGTELNPDAEATVWYNEQMDEVLFSGLGLPELQEDLSFQLWAIIDGTPSDMGVIEWTPDQKVLNVKFRGTPQAFAITIEPNGVENAA